MAREVKMRRHCVSLMVVMLAFLVFAGAARAQTASGDKPLDFGGLRGAIEPTPELEKQWAEERAAYDDRYFNIFPTFDFRYQYVVDWSPLTSNFHAFDATCGLGVPVLKDGYDANRFTGFRPAIATIAEFGEVANRSARRTALLGRVYGEYETTCNFLAIMGGRSYNVREDFPFERSHFTRISIGLEAGFVQSRELTPDSGSMDGTRIGLLARGGFLVIEPALSWAAEFYDGRRLDELTFSIGIPRPLIPFGLTLGYRWQSMEGFHQSAFTVGVEASF